MPLPPARHGLSIQCRVLGGRSQVVLHGRHFTECPHRAAREHRPWSASTGLKKMPSPGEGRGRARKPIADAACEPTRRYRSHTAVRMLPPRDIDEQDREPGDTAAWKSETRWPRPRVDPPRRFGEPRHRASVAPFVGARSREVLCDKLSSRTSNHHFRRPDHRLNFVTVTEEKPGP